MGFPPVGVVMGDGMAKVCDRINTEYGEGQPSGRGPSQGRIQQQGNAYMRKEYPNLDYIKSVTIAK